MMEHTKEPWFTSNSNAIFSGGTRICGVDYQSGQFEPSPNARRIVACVNACAGFAIEEIEGANLCRDSIGVGNEIDRLKQQRDKLLAALEQGARDFISANGTKPKWWTSNIQLIAEIKAAK